MKHCQRSDVRTNKLLGGVTMKKLLFYLGLVIFALTMTAFTSKKAMPIEGNWIGEFTAIDQSMPVRVHFWTENDELKGTIRMSGDGAMELPLSWVVVEASNVHFELVQDCGTLVFDGTLKDGRITGKILCSNLRGQFQLAPANLASL